MTNQLKQKRDRLLAEIGKLTRLRQGQLSKQYYTKTDEEGRPYRQGPYYVWQSWRSGRKQSVRIPSDQVPQVEKEIQAYREYKRLVQELADVTEQITLTTR